MVLGESLTLGYRALMWSAQKAAEEEEEELTKGQIAISMAIAFVLFAGLFIVLPAVAAGWMAGDSGLAFASIEAVLRLALFIGYLWAIGRSKEIRRVFQYHGAEHMSIHAFESGEPLSVESVARYRPEHPRCGTNFLMIVILLSIVVFTVVDIAPWFTTAYEEVAAVGRAAGVALPADAVERTLNFNRNAPPHLMPSMGVDLLRGNRIELPWLSGKVVELGRKHGVPTPTHAFMYATLKPYIMGKPV
jgi:uncharacterized protein YqhQ